MIKKEKVTLNASPFQFKVNKVVDDLSEEEPIKRKRGWKPPVGERPDGNPYQIKYLERIVELCKRNCVTSLKMPSGIELTLNVAPIEPDVLKKLKRLKKKESTPEARERAANARKKRQEKIAKKRALEISEKENETKTDEDILFWSS